MAELGIRPRSQRCAHTGIRSELIAGPGDSDGAPVLWALEGVSEARLRGLAESTAAGRPSPAQRWLHCRRCGRKIAREADRLDVDGRHEHVRTNPHGITFRFGSFSAANGCITQGEPVAAFSWFPGFYWRLAMCGGCGIHLGWCFEGTLPGFFGLVLDRLTPSAS